MWRAIALALVAVCGCGDKEVTGFIDDARQASNAILLEGLPHQGFEEEAFKQELRTRELVHVQGYPFYAERLSLEPGDGDRLKEMLASAGRYKAWEGEKKCGGFHPDYAVAFEGQYTRAYALLCFGCEEVRLSTLWVDARRDMTAIDDVRELLERYGKNRPEKSY